MLHIVNHLGRRFSVRVIRHGDAYGRSRAEIHRRIEPVVEIYDATYAGKNGFEPEGQIICQYGVGAVLEASTEYSLSMDKYEEWTLTSANLRELQDWLRSQPETMAALTLSRLERKHGPGLS